MDLTLIQGTISGLKLAGDIAKGFLELKSIADVQGKVIELQSAILSAQSSALAANADQAAVVQEVRNLKEDIARMKAWEEQKQRYKLTSPWQGCVVYALKEKCSGAEPPHWICTKCYEDGVKSVRAAARRSFQAVNFSIQISADHHGHLLCCQQRQSARVQVLKRMS